MLTVSRLGKFFAFACMASGTFLLGTAESEERGRGRSMDASLLFRTTDTKIIGGLGVPLGTIAHVTGICVDGTSVRISRYKDKLLLDIETVNGKPKDDCPLYIHPGFVGDTILPKPGDRFDYYVHEWGEFTGRVELPEGIEPAGPEESIGQFGLYLRLKIHPRSEIKQDEKG